MHQLPMPCMVGGRSQCISYPCHVRYEVVHNESVLHTMHGRRSFTMHVTHAMHGRSFTMHVTHAMHGRRSFTMHATHAMHGKRSFTNACYPCHAW